MRYSIDRQVSGYIGDTTASLLILTTPFGRLREAVSCLERLSREATQISPSRRCHGKERFFSHWKFRSDRSGNRRNFTFETTRRSRKGGIAERASGNCRPVRGDFGGGGVICRELGRKNVIGFIIGKQKFACMFG